MASSPPSVYNGLVVVDKPAGMTSHDVVNAARRLYRTKRVGHTGTLDPDATGVLVLCLGYATRIAEYLSAARKHYVTQVVFGIETDSQDASGKIVAERDASALTEAAVLALLPRFRGAIQQVPPMVSALHHQGKRLYELAREGVTVERAARDVQIDTLELRAFQPGEHPVATLDVTCSTGTYIRTLAADLGEAAGTGGMMQTLRRLWVGDSPENAFSLENAHTLEALAARADNGTLAETVLPLSRALALWTSARLTPGQTSVLRQGQGLRLDERLALTTASIGREDGLIAVYDPHGEVFAIAQLRDDQLRPVKVLT